MNNHDQELVQELREAAQHQAHGEGYMHGLLRRAAARISASAQQPASVAVLDAEARFEHYLQIAIDRAPDPLRRLGEYLAHLLDEDLWPAAERMLNAAIIAATHAPEAQQLACTCPSGDGSLRHPCPRHVAQGVSAAARDVLAERQRQITDEGMTNAGDDCYHAAELPRAAAAYILNGANDGVPSIWPWQESWWKPRDARTNYVRAGALILAEIDRIDRQQSGSPVGPDLHQQEAAQ